MFLFLECFQRQNVLNLFLFSVNLSYLLKATITPDTNNWGYFSKEKGHVISKCTITDIKHFNTALEKYEVKYSRGTSNYIANDDFDEAQVILLQLNL